MSQTMILIDKDCKKCGTQIRLTKMQSYWCEECCTRKEYDEVKDR